jgi:hypothetical protein
MVPNDNSLSSKPKPRHYNFKTLKFWEADQSN